MNLLLTFTCFTLCILASVNNGFLLDDRTQPPTQAAVVLTDNHFNMLLSLLLEEKQARVGLENEVQQLRKELLVTQQGVTNNYHAGQKHNETLTLQSVTLRKLDDTYNALQMKYDSLILEFNELKTNHSILLNHTIQISEELDVLKQIKSVNDLQAILTVQNQSKHLEKELQATNTMLNAVASDVSARNQDFIALFNKADAAEQKMEMSVRELNTSLNNTLMQLDRNKNNTDALLQKLENNQRISQTHLNTSIQTQLSMIKSNQNLTVTNLKAELYDLYLKMPDRVAVTSCAKDGSYQANSIILFPDIKTRKGISSNGVTSLGNNGKFVCERAGMYLITSFIMTSTDSTNLAWYKNNDVIAYNYFTMTHFHQTHTVSVLEQLNVNDSVYMKTVTTMYIHGSTYSCISILQITG